jgi:uncharacterized membrane protein YagU involved in acid resistance
MRRLAWIVAGALVIGTLDAVYAIVFWGMRGVGPISVFQSIAAGLLGQAAFRGGLRTEALGVALHYTIALGIVVVYWIASRSLTVLRERPILCGAIYGILVYLFMNYIVIPLSATSRSRFLLSWIVGSVIVHAFLIGVPAALFARKALQKKSGG